MSNPKKVDPRNGLSGRTFVRTQGCWNCKHFSLDKAKDWWKVKRQQDLEYAMSLALLSPMGENDPKVVGLRRMIDAVDVGLSQSVLGMCLGSGVDAEDNLVGDLVRSVYLCRKWSGAQGASVAREGEAPDLLPMELREREDKPS